MRKLLLGLIAALPLAGCEVRPNLTYHLLSDPGPSDARIPYRLTDTRIVIGPVGKDKEPIDLRPQILNCDLDGCGASAKGDMVEIAGFGAAIDDRTQVFAIEPHTRHLVSTQITPTYYDGSLRLATLDVDTRDHRLEAINTIGAIASGAMNIAADQAQSSDKASKPLQLPILIDLADAKAVMATGKKADLPLNAGWTFTAKFEDGDLGKQGFLPRARYAQVHAGIVSATCRPMSITLERINKDTGLLVSSLTIGLTVADPDWLTVIPLPAKGTVDFHPLCGVDVKAGPNPAVGADALAEGFFKQVAALRSPKQ